MRSICTAIVLLAWQGLAMAQIAAATSPATLPTTSPAASQPTSQPGEKIVLVWKLKPGTYTCTTDGQAQTSDDGKPPVTSTYRIAREFTIHPKDAKGLQKVEMTLRLQMQAMESEPMTEVRDPDLNKAFYIIFDAEGKIVKVGPKDLVAETPEEDRPGFVLAKFDRLFFVASRLPKTKVAIGDTWKAETPLPLAILPDLPIKETITLKDFRHRGQQLLAAFELTGKGAAKPGKVQHRNIPMEVDGLEYSSTERGMVDLETGLLVEWLTDSKLNMDVASRQEGVRMKIKQESTGRVESKIVPGTYEASTQPASQPSPK